MLQLEIDLISFEIFILCVLLKVRKQYYVGYVKNVSITTVFLDDIPDFFIIMWNSYYQSRIVVFFSCILIQSVVFTMVKSFLEECCVHIY